jgi:hypothetical protein
MSQENVEILRRMYDAFHVDQRTRARLPARATARAG